MAKENIELHIIHNPKLNTEDTGFAVAIFIDGVDKSVLELSQEQMLHIGAILINASKVFIKNANKIKGEITMATIKSFTDIEQSRKLSEILSLEQGQKPQGKSALDAAQEEKVDNQNCVKPADKVKPKFNVGDWIIHQGTENIYQVVAIINNQYQLKYGDNYTTQYCKDVDRCTRLWDVAKDAKDGDVLASNRSIFIFSQEYIAGKPEAYCGIMNGLFLVKSEGCWTNEKYYPATKEQRDTLMKAMTNAGYTFDFEKKELKKIDNVILTTWSEEDENRFNNLCQLIDASNDNELTKNGFKNWLKSFRHHITWKPSDEQLNNIFDVLSFDNCTPKRRELLESLYNDLKKLKKK